MNYFYTFYLFLFQRSYAAVVRNNINTSVHLSNKNETNTSNIRIKHEKQPIIVEAGLSDKATNLVNKTKSGSSCRDGGASGRSSGQTANQQVISEDVHPYLKQLEQALELEVKYR